MARMRMQKGSVNDRGHRRRPKSESNRFAPQVRRPASAAVCVGEMASHIGSQQGSQEQEEEMSWSSSSFPGGEEDGEGEEELVEGLHEEPLHDTEEAFLSEMARNERRTRELFREGADAAQEMAEAMEREESQRMQAERAARREQERRQAVYMRALMCVQKPATMILHPRCCAQMSLFERIFQRVQAAAQQAFDEARMQGNGGAAGSSRGNGHGVFVHVGNVPAANPARHLVSLALVGMASEGGVQDFDGFRMDLLTQAQRAAFIKQFGGRKWPLAHSWPPNPYVKKTGNPQAEQLLLQGDLYVTVGLNEQGLRKSDVNRLPPSPRSRQPGMGTPDGVGTDADDERMEAGDGEDDAEGWSPQPHRGNAGDRRVTPEEVYGALRAAAESVKDPRRPGCDALHFLQLEDFARSSVVLRTMGGDQDVLGKKIMQPFADANLPMGIFGHNQKGRLSETEVFDFLAHHGTPETWHWTAIANMQPYSTGIMHLYRKRTSDPTPAHVLRQDTHAPALLPAGQMEFFNVGPGKGCTWSWRASEAQRKESMNKNAWHLRNNFTPYALLKALVTGEEVWQRRDLGYFANRHANKAVSYTNLTHALKPMVYHAAGSGKIPYMPSDGEQIRQQAVGLLKASNWVRTSLPSLVQGAMETDPLHRSHSPHTPELWTQREPEQESRVSHAVVVGGLCERLEVTVVRGSAQDIGVAGPEAPAELTEEAKAECVKQFHQWMAQMFTTFRLELVPAEIHPEDLLDLKNHAEDYALQIEASIEVLLGKLRAREWRYESGSRGNLFATAEAQAALADIRALCFVTSSDDREAQELHVELKKIEEDMLKQQHRQEAGRRERREKARAAATLQAEKELQAAEEARAAREAVRREAETARLHASERALAAEELARREAREAEAARELQRANEEKEAAHLRLMEARARVAQANVALRYSEALEQWLEGIKGKKTIFPAMLKTMGVKPKYRVPADRAEIKKVLLADRTDHFGVHEQLRKLHGDFTPEESPVRWDTRPNWSGADSHHESSSDQASIPPDDHSMGGAAHDVGAAAHDEEDSMSDGLTNPLDIPSSHNEDSLSSSDEG